MIRFAAVALALVATAAPAAPLAQSPPELLSRMDANGDGRVALAEYQDYLSYGFRALDVDGSGIVDLDEFPMATVNGRTRPVSLAQHRANIAATFRAQDGDGDGYLGVADIAAPPR